MALPSPGCRFAPSGNTRVIVVNTLHTDRVKEVVVARLEIGQGIQVDGLLAGLAVEWATLLLLLLLCRP